MFLVVGALPAGRCPGVFLAHLARDHGLHQQPHPGERVQGADPFPAGNMDTTAYKMLLSYQSLWSRSYRNTIFYIILSCAITGTLTIVAGFVFSRNRFFYRNTFMLIISFTMLFNGGMIPLHGDPEYRHGGHHLGLGGARLSSVFNIILMRTSMQEISDSLEEAARLDGANDFIIMFKIVLPLCKATFAVIMLFTIVMKWNDYMSALLYLPTKTELYPCRWNCGRSCSSPPRRSPPRRTCPARRCTPGMWNMVPL